MNAITTRNILALRRDGSRRANFGRNAFSKSMGRCYTHSDFVRFFRLHGHFIFMNIPIHFRRPATRSAHVSPLAVLAINLAAAVSVRAGMVTWGPATTITGGADVSTAGTLVVAHNLGDSTIANTTVNGVTFTKFVTNGPTNTVGNVTLSSSGNILGSTNFGEFVGDFPNLLPTSYQKLIESGSVTGGSTPPPAITLTLAGLNAGTQYQFQWWANQSSFFSFDPLAPPPAFPSTTATAGNSVTLSRTGPLAGSLGQYALGVFTADASGQQVISFVGSNPQTILNAFQLRALSAPAVPEPGSCLFGMAMTGVVLRSMCGRRRSISQP